MAIAKSYLLEAKSLRAYEILKGIDPKVLPSEEARLSWRMALISACCGLSEFEHASDLLRESERAIRPFVPLKISGECFTSKPPQRVRIESPRFRPGETVTLYLDVERLGFESQKDGSAKTRVRFDLALLEPSGRVVSDFSDWEREHGTVEESSHRPWEEHAYRVSFLLPKGVNLGAYLLRVEVSDLTSTPTRNASASLPLVLK